MNKLPENILALASIAQTSALVNDLAISGQCDAKSCDTSIESLVKSSNKASEIYASNDDLSIGISALKQMLKKSSSNKNILLYCLSLIKLEKALMREQKMLDKIAGTINEIKNTNYIDINHENSIKKLATTYKESAGKLQPTIMINGKPENLKNHNIANHIRALLLAGIRSVSLWRSSGGSLLQLVFNKKKIINQLEQFSA
jgi:high frequency lysogenization protein